LCWDVGPITFFFFNNNWCLSLIDLDTNSDLFLAIQVYFIFFTSSTN
jgi:hypothetical protein